METEVKIVRMLTVDTFDFTLRIDLYVLKVQYGKRIGYMTAWCESGKDIHSVLNENREIRLSNTMNYYIRINRTQYWNAAEYEKFEFYFPSSTTELKAKKHFQKMAELAPKTKFINQ